MPSRVSELLLASSAAMDSSAASGRGSWMSFAGRQLVGGATVLALVFTVPFPALGRDEDAMAPKLEETISWLQDKFANEAHSSMLSVRNPFGGVSVTRITSELSGAGCALTFTEA